MHNPILKSFAMKICLWVLAALALICLPAQMAAAQTVAAPPAASSPPAASDSVIRDGSYQLAPGDKVNVTIFDEPDMSGEFVVSSAGNISFPLIGNIDVQNMTLDAFQAALVQRLSPNYLRDPKITVSVLNYRPYYILGEVNAPGEYPYIDNLNVLNAIAKAGGFTYRAKTTKIFIRRANESAEKPYSLDADTKVAPGDTIRVTERYF